MCGGNSAASAQDNEQFWSISPEEILDDLRADLSASRNEVVRFLKDVERQHKENSYKLPTPKQAILHEDRVRSHYQHLLQDIEFFAARTQATGRNKEIALEVLEQHLRTTWHQAEWNPQESKTPVWSFRQIYETVAGLIEDGLDDDTLLQVYANLLWGNGQNEEALQIYERLDAKDDDIELGRNYYVLFRFEHLWTARKANRPEEELKQLRRKAFLSFADLLRTHPEGEDPNFPWQLGVMTPEKMEFDDYREQAVVIVNEQDISKFHRHLVIARYFDNLSWKHRGTGAAYTVTEAGWRKFHEYGTQAAEHYQRAFHLEPTVPAPPMYLIGVARSGNDPLLTVDDWFLSSVQNDYGNMVPFHALAYSKDPRWGGSFEEMINFAFKVSEVDAWQTPVPYYSLEILEQVIHQHPERDRFGEHPVVASIAVNIINKMVQAHRDGQPIQPPIIRHLGRAIAILWQAEEFELLNQFNDIWPDLPGDRAVEWTASHLEIFAEARIMTSPVAARYRAYRQQRSEGLSSSDEKTLKGTIELAAELNAEVDHPFVNQWFENHIREYDQRIRFMNGETIELNFDRVEDWQIRAPDAQIVDEKTVAVRRFGEIRAIGVRPRATFPPPYEIEMTVIIPEDHQSAQLPESVSIQVGEPIYWPTSKLNLHQFGVSADGSKLVGRDYLSPEQKYRLFRTKLKSHPITLKLEYWTDFSQCYVNDRPICWYPLTPVEHPEIFTISSASSNASPHFQFALTNLKIKRIADSQEDRRIAFSEAKVADNPNNPMVHVDQARIYFDMGRYDQAAEAADDALEIDPKHWDARMVKCGVYYFKQDYPSAIELADELLEERPNDSELVTNYVWYHVYTEDREDRDLDRVVEMAQELCERTQYQDSWKLSAYAGALAATNQFEKAVQLCFRALELTDSESSKEYFLKAIKAYRNRELLVK